jgi:GTP cyclohydrolase IA
MSTHPVTWSDVEQEAKALAARTEFIPTGVFGVPRGGVAVAVLVAQHLAVPILDAPEPGCLVVDDLVDSGVTLAPYAEAGYACDTLYRKPHSPEHLAPGATLLDAWITFPWETDGGAPTDAVRRLLEWVGEDPTREGLLDTPKRVAKAWREMTVGYAEDPGSVLGTTFDVACDQLVAVTGIEFVSLCEHHVLPFTGVASVGYLPGERVVGLSKLGRVVDTFSRRLQVQERMTAQIAEAIQEHLAPQGVAVVVRGQHSCMSCRGVRKRSEMVTSAMLGEFRTNAELRNEFLALERSK